ncbi:SlyX family protein [Lacisediminimonas profundi]|uniref:SlyX family protein n=1 Tax=Lacisediminimonas profundi TaxID=2603856 RepID=UPI00124B293C|nr:SlyX family protein [Lacisediminimonas profundi]
MNEDRLVDIEIKLTRQEDLLETLNRTVFRQQQKIDELESLCTALAMRMRDVQEGQADSGAANEKPPHY